MVSPSSRPLLATDSNDSSSDDGSGEEAWDTAYESTNYDGSDDDAWLAAAMSVMTVETKPGVLCAFLSNLSHPMVLTNSSSNILAVVPAAIDSAAPIDPLSPITPSLTPSPPSPPSPQGASTNPVPSSTSSAPNLNRANKMYAINTPKLDAPRIANHW